MRIRECDSAKTMQYSRKVSLRLCSHQIRVLQCCYLFHDSLLWKGKCLIFFSHASTRLQRQAARVPSVCFIASCISIAICWPGVLEHDCTRCRRVALMVHMSSSHGKSISAGRSQDCTIKGYTKYLTVVIQTHQQHIFLARYLI